MVPVARPAPMRRRGRRRRHHRRRAGRTRAPRSPPKALPAGPSRRVTPGSWTCATLWPRRPRRRLPRRRASQRRRRAGHLPRPPARSMRLLAERAAPRCPAPWTTGPARSRTRSRARRAGLHPPGRQPQAVCLLRGAGRGRQARPRAGAARTRPPRRQQRAQPGTPHRQASRRPSTARRRPMRSRWRSQRRRWAQSCRVWALPATRQQPAAARLQAASTERGLPVGGRERLQGRNPRRRGGGRRRGRSRARAWRA